MSTLDAPLTIIDKNRTLCIAPKPFQRQLINLPLRLFRMFNTGKYNLIEKIISLLPMPVLPLVLLG